MGDNRRTLEWERYTGGGGGGGWNLTDIQKNLPSSQNLSSAPPFLYPPPPPYSSQVGLNQREGERGDIGKVQVAMSR
jgi:hypothetical protein